MDKKFWQTVNCIVCLKPAEHWTGHVIKKNGRVVTAGFCGEHMDTPCPDLIDRIGCFGGYHKSYKIK